MRVCWFRQNRRSSEAISVKKEMTFGSVGRNHCAPRFTKTASLLVFSKPIIVRYNLISFSIDRIELG